MASATRSIVINAPREKVFEVVSGYEKYPEFLPKAKKVIVTRKGDSADVKYEVDVIKTITYTLRMKEERPNKVSWTFVNGEFMKDNRGSWVLEDAGEGKTRATYTVDISLGALVPRSIEKALAETELPSMLEAFKKRAESAK
jgi:coenzyme Q-binding protein COQ10